MSQYHCTQSMWYIFRLKRQVSEIAQPVFISLFIWAMTGISKIVHLNLVKRRHLNIINCVICSRMFWIVSNSNENSYVHNIYGISVTISTTIFFVFQLHQEMNNMTLAIIIVQALFGIVAVCSSCDLGQRSSDKWNEISLRIDQFKWYMFPNELNQILPTIIATAQQPVELKCFGSLTLSRQTLKKVRPLNPRMLDLSTSIF